MVFTCLYVFEDVTFAKVLRLFGYIKVTRNISIDLIIRSKVATHENCKFECKFRAMTVSSCHLVSLFVCQVDNLDFNINLGLFAI